MTGTVAQNVSITRKIESVNNVISTAQPIPAPCSVGDLSQDGMLAGSVVAAHTVTSDSKMVLEESDMVEDLVFWSRAKKKSL
jgi:hypothetical protein